VIDPTVKELATGKNFVALTTLFGDGHPQTQIMWVGADDEHVLINTEIRRQKFRNVQRDPRVTVTTARIAAEASRCGMSLARATEMIDDLLDRSTDAIAAARDETDGLPDAVVATVRGQLRHLRPAAPQARERSMHTRSQ